MFCVGLGLLLWNLSIVLSYFKKTDFKKNLLKKVENKRFLKYQRWAKALKHFSSIKSIIFTNCNWISEAFQSADQLIWQFVRHTFHWIWKCKKRRICSLERKRTFCLQLLDFVWFEVSCPKKIVAASQTHSDTTYQHHKRAL